MRCNNCFKTIPDVSIVCPYCNKTVDPNAKVPVDFGDISDVNYDSNKFDIKVFVKEPKNRKLVVGAIAIAVFVVVIFIALVMSMFSSKKTPSYEIFTGVVDDISEYLDDNFLFSRTSADGTYDITVDINGKSSAFDGNYAFDIKNKIFKLDGTMKDPEEETGDIVIDSKDLSFITYLKDANLYFKSDELFSNYLYFPIDDEIGLLKTKQYDLSSLVSGIVDATDDTLKEMSYETSSEKINYRGEDKTLNKVSLVLDASGKKKFLSSFYQCLIDDSNFVSELARIKDKKSDDIVKILENYKKTAEYKYSADSNDSIVVSIYHSSTKIYRILVEVKDDKNEKYQLDIGETKYYFDYFVDDDNKISATLAYNYKETDIKTIKNYDITFDSDKYITNISLELEENVKSTVKKMEITDYKNIRDLSLLEIEELKNKTSYYVSDTSFIDKVVEAFKDKCTSDLVCSCVENEDTCQCEYNDKFITCDKTKVSSNAVDSNETTTTTTALTSVN